MNIAVSLAQDIDVLICGKFTESLIGPKAQVKGDKHELITLRMYCIDRSWVPENSGARRCQFAHDMLHWLISGK